MIIFADLSTSVLFVDLLFAAAMLLFGAIAGWLLSPRGPAADNSDKNSAQEAIDRLRELASTVAADVGHHASRMQEINTGLVEAQAGKGSLENVVIDSVADIIKANEALQLQLATAEVRLQRQEEELKSQLEAARTDALTGVCNRRAFDDELSRRIAEWQRRKTLFSLVMIDVDHFKRFNDTHGHQAGDEVLKGVAGALKYTVREMDFIARYGGEEFAAVLPVTNEREALIAAERIRVAVEKATFQYDRNQLQVTCSVGVAQVLGDNSTAEIIKRADAALYHSKSAGRNCVHYHDGEACRPLAAIVAEASRPKPVRETIAETQDEPVRASQPAAQDVDDTYDASQEPQSRFHSDLRRRVLEARKFHVPLSLVMIEIDGFDGLTEKHGAAISDLVYDTMADFLRVVMQEMDVAMRRGNGQFAIMMPGTDRDCAVMVSERLRMAVEGHTMQIKGVTLRVTLSVGIAETMDHDDSGTLTKRAGVALFTARGNGQNCTYVHDGERCELASQLLVSC